MFAEDTVSSVCVQALVLALGAVVGTPFLLILISPFV